MGGGCKPGVTGGQVRLGKRAVGVGAQCHTHPLPLCTYCMGAYCMGLRDCWVAGHACPRRGRRRYVHQPSHQCLAVGGRR
jgi:hypothetical protein